MSERSVGIRELRSKLSECLRDVKRGATIVVTEHGRKMARVILYDLVRVPVTEALVSRAEALAWDHGLRGYDAVQLV
jgi:prevent-host-death family protein